MTKWNIECADVVEWAEGYEGPEFHAMLADPPYHLGKKGFMGKAWDAADYGISFQSDTWTAIAEHLHPGAFGMTFASSRGWHRLAVAIEDAGMIIHPSIFCWIQGQGFPKATRIDTQIDKMAGVEREIVGENQNRRTGRVNCSVYERGNATVANQHITAPATDLAKQWEGHRYGLQSMKPCAEPIILWQKPYEGKPVECITGTGAGALNIDGGRVRTNQSLTGGSGRLWSHYRDGTEAQLPPVNNQGRWPPNFCLVHHFECKRVGSTAIKPLEGHRPNPVAVQSDGQIQFNTKPEGYQKISYTDPDGTETIEAWDCHPQCPVRRLGEQTPNIGNKWKRNYGEENYQGRQYGGGSFGGGGYMGGSTYADTGTAARFYPNCSWAYEIEEQIHSADPFRYVPKASRSERDAGLNEMPLQFAPKGNYEGRDMSNPKNKLGGLQSSIMRNPHLTCKPISLTKWLATLLLPPDMYAPRRLLIPFSGVASEAIGATLAGWDHITLIEMDQSYCDIAESRLQFWNGWKERGLDEPKAILKAAKKATKDNGGQLDLL